MLARRRNAPGADKRRCLGAHRACRIHARRGVGARRRREHGPRDGLVARVHPLDRADAVGIRAEQVGVAREHRQQLTLPRQRLSLQVGQHDRHRRRRGRVRCIGNRRSAIHANRHIDRRHIVDDLDRRGPVSLERHIVVRLLLDRRGHRRRRPRRPGAARRPLRTRRPTARAARALGLRSLALVILLATTLGILALGNIAKHAARARTHRVQVQPQQVGNLDKVRIDHVAIAQRIDERQRILKRFGTTARRGNVARLLQ